MTEDILNEDHLPHIPSERDTRNFKRKQLVEWKPTIKFQFL